MKAMQRMIAFSLVLMLMVGYIPAQVFATEETATTETVPAQTETIPAETEETVAQTEETVPATEEVTVPEETTPATEEVTVPEETAPAAEEMIPEKKPLPGKVGESAVVVGNAEDAVDIQLDTDATAEITEGGQMALFRFTSAITDAYAFSSDTDDDPRGYLYDSDMNQVAYDDDDGENANFYLEYVLEAGQTYYLGVNYWNESDTGSVPVRLTICHSYSSEVVKESTCTVLGTMLYTCNYCDYSYTEEIPANHEFDYGVCDVCGEAENMESVLEYHVNEDDTTTVSVTGYTGDAKNVKIPATLDGKTVTSVELSYTDLTGISLPDTLVRIYEYAFSDNYSLKCISIPAGVTEIGDYAFGWCNSLKHIFYTGTQSQWDALDVTAGNAVVESAVVHTGVESCDMTQLLKDVETCESYDVCCTVCEEALFSTAKETFTHNIVDSWCTICGMADPDVACGKKIIWSLSEDGVLTLTGQGDMYDYGTWGEEAPPWNEDRYLIQKIVIGSGITGIGDFAFYNYYNMTEVTIPNTVTTIGENAFEYCHVLESITIPASVTDIGGGAFDSCRSLTGIWVDAANPNYSSDSYGVLFDKNKTRLIQCPGAFAGAYDIPETVTQIDAYAFRECYLTAVTIPEGVTEIKYYTFAYCYELERVSLPSTITRIGGGAFASCGELVAITIPASVTTMDYDALGWCNALRHVFYTGTQEQWDAMERYGDITWLTNATVHCEVTSTQLSANLNQVVTCDSYDEHCSVCQELLFSTEKTPATHNIVNSYCIICGKADPAVACGDKVIWSLSEDGVLTITGQGDMYDYDADGENAYPWYESRESIKKVVIGSGITSIGDKVFNGCGSLTEVTIPNTVTRIGEYAFGYCYSLKEIHLPDTVTQLENGVFYCCNLSEVTLPAGIQEISAWLFGYCHSLKRIAIPEGVTSIDYGAFFSCSNLVAVVIPDSVTQINYGAFDYCDALDHVFFTGTQEQWDAILADAGSINCIQDATVHCDVQSADFADLLTNVETCDSYDEQCPVCQEVLFSTEKTPATHNIVNSYCTICGKADPAIACGDKAIWSLSEDGVLTVTGQGDIYDYSSWGEDVAPWYDNRYQIKKVVISSGITGIGDCAFYDCYNLKEVTIPDTVTQMGESAFYSCDRLKEITIPNGMTWIPDAAFQYCGELAYVVIPESITEIRYDAFYNCYNFTHVFYTGSQEQWDAVTINDYSSVWESAVIHVGLKNVAPADILVEVDACETVDSQCAICQQALFSTRKETYNHTYVNYFCSRCGEVDPEVACGEKAVWTLSADGVLTISGQGGMYDYSNPWYGVRASIKSVVISDGITYIGSYVFEYCNNLESVTLGAGVADMGYSPFYGCGKLNKFTVSAKNAQFSSDSNGLLYNKDKTELILVPGAKTTVAIPSTVKRIADSAFSHNQNLSEVTIPNGVVSIGESAFFDCSGLKKVTIPNSVTTIESHAFAYCSSLTAITIPNSVTSLGGEMFMDCGSLTSATLSTSLTSIPGWLFEGCSNLKSVTIPSGVTQIGSGAFYHCGSLTAVTIPSGVTAIAHDTFYGCGSLKSITLPSSIKEIGYDAFVGCCSLTGITLPAGLSQIGENAFRNCTSLTAITIPAATGYVGENAFYGCSALTGLAVASANEAYSGDTKGALYNKDKTFLIWVPDALSGAYTIPDSVTEIYYDAFDNCTKLTSIAVGAGVVELSGDMLGDCGNLAKITVSANNPNYSSDSNGVLYNKDKTQLIYVPPKAKLTSIPAGIKTIGDCAFAGREDLTSITIPNSVTSIGYYAFANCENLTTVNFGTGVQSIGDDAFAQCSSLKSISLPASVTQIGSHAFDECSSLSSVSLSEGLTYLGYAVFADCSSLKSIKLPNSLTELNGSMFGGCTALQTVTLPNKLEEIGSSAFYGCRILKSITIPETVSAIGSWAFEDCTALESVNIPKGLEILSYGVFAGCTSLKSINIPASVTDIHDDAFNGCTSLTGIWVDKANPYYVSDSNGVVYNKAMTELICFPGGFKGVYTLPDSVTSFDHWALSSCPGLTGIKVGANNPDYSSDSVGALFNKNKTSLLLFPRGYTGSYTVPSTVKEIDWTAFENCNLSGIILPEGLEWIDGFENCKNLKSVTIPKSVTTIGYGAFQNCDALTEVTIPANVTSIQKAFTDCDNLQKYTVDAGNSTFSSDASGLLLSKDGTELYHVPNGKSGSFTVPSNIKTIGSGAFYSCKKLTTITVPDTVTELMHGSFENCGASTVTIGNGVTELDMATFNRCDNLNQVVLGKNIKYVREAAFGWYGYENSIDCIEFTGNMPIFDSYAFFGVTATVYYPANNTTWVAAKMQDYYGDITWVKAGSQNGLVQVNGTWGYYKNGVLQAGYTGLVQNAAGTWYYVEEGIINWNYTGAVAHNGVTYYVQKGRLVWGVDGLVQCSNGDWYYVTNSKVNTGFTGLVKHSSGTYYYVLKGKLDWSYTGVVTLNGVTYYVQKGRLVWGVNGLVKCNNGAWYYVTNSRVNTGYTGLVKHSSGTYYYILKGKLDWSYTGITTYGGTTYYIQGGTLKWGANGLVKCNDGSWYYVTNSRVNTTFTGLVQYSGGGWYYVQKGKINFGFTGLVQHTSGNWYYVQKGSINWNFTGLVQNSNGIWYYVQKGSINFNYTGLVKHANGTWYYVQKGRLVWGYNGLVKHTNGTLYYVRNSSIDWTYNGTATYGGKTYTVVNGVAK